MIDYVISTVNGLQVMSLRDIPAATNPNSIIAEVVEDEDTDDPLVILRNPLANPYDFWWPFNMFGGKLFRLSILRRNRNVRRAG